MSEHNPLWAPMPFERPQMDRLLDDTEYVPNVVYRQVGRASDGTRYVCGPDGLWELVNESSPTPPQPASEPSPPQPAST